MNYTWSHEIDNEVNVFSGYSHPFNPNLDRSSGDIDVRQNFTTSVVYDFPNFKKARLLKRQLAGGWETSSIVQARSGLPTNISLVSDFFGNPMRPNFANPDGGICSSVGAATATAPASCVTNPNFGRSGQTIADVAGGAIGNGTSRQAQFALKVLF